MIDLLILALLTASWLLFVAGRAQVRRAKLRNSKLRNTRPWFTSTQRGWLRHTNRRVSRPSRRFEQ